MIAVACGIMSYILVINVGRVRWHARFGSPMDAHATAVALLASWQSAYGGGDLGLGLGVLNRVAVWVSGESYSDLLWERGCYGA